MSEALMLLKEKTAKYGTSVMSVYSNAELIALAVGADPEKIKEAEDYGQDSIVQLMRNPKALPGIGNKKSVIIEAIKEIAKRITVEQSGDLKKVIHGPDDVARILMPAYRYEQKEHFGVMCLNTKNSVIRTEDVSIGSLSASVVHPREVFKAATNNTAASIIIFHNHPSGDPAPSREDVAVTTRLVKAGKIMDIPVLDHIIIGDGRFYSLKEHGLF